MVVVRVLTGNGEVHYIGEYKFETIEGGCLRLKEWREERRVICAVFSNNYWKHACYEEEEKNGKR
jgi:hypothetical protein